MKKIYWNENFSVGISKIDEQHKKIIKMINSLIEIYISEIFTEKISDILNEMSQYALKHFETEEQLMKEHNYPDYTPHAIEHQEFKMKTVRLSADTIKHKELVPAETLIYLKEWWINHILSTDMKFKSFFKSKGII